MSDSAILPAEKPPDAAPSVAPSEGQSPTSPLAPRDTLPVADQKTGASSSETAQLPEVSAQGASAPSQLNTGEATTDVSTTPNVVVVAVRTPAKAAGKTKGVAQSPKGESAGKKRKTKKKQSWQKRFFDRLLATGLLVSLLLHVVLLLGLTMIVLPAKDREMIVGAILAAIDTESSKDELDTAALVPEKLESTTTDAAPIAITTPLVATTNPTELNVNDLDPRAAVETDAPGPQVKFEGQLGGRSKAAKASLVAQGGGTVDSEKAVNSGLKWIADQQKADGSWSWDRGGKDEQALKNTTGATSLALLAFLGGGHTHKKGQGDYQKTVQKGLDYLVSQMEVTPEGGCLFGKDFGHGPMYIQGLAAIALCEAYALTTDRRLLRPTQEAIDFIVHAQDPKGGGWRYQRQQKGDTSVTGWQIMALKSAQLAKKIKIPATTIGKSTFFLKSVESEGGAKYGYEGPGATPTMTAVGLLCRMYLGWTPKTPALQKGVEYLSMIGPSANDLYYNYYATQVLHHWGGEAWTKWNSVMREHLVKTQLQDGDDVGSWKPTGDHGSGPGGRLYQTCFSVMTLEVYYRHLPLYQREKMSAEF